MHPQSDPLRLGVRDVVGNQRIRLHQRLHAAIAKLCQNSLRVAVELTQVGLSAFSALEEHFAAFGSKGEVNATACIVDRGWTLRG